MRTRVYDSIDGIGPTRLAALATGLDLSFGVLRAMERSLWGDLTVRYLTVEGEGGAVLAFQPVYLGSNLNLNALLPGFVQRGYDALVRGLGSAAATRIAVAGSLISDRGWIPMRSDLTDRPGAIRLLAGALDQVAREHRAQLGAFKDLHRDFPADERALLRDLGFTECLSLPTIRINTAYPSFEDFLARQLSKNGRRHARKQFNKAEGVFTLRAIEDFESWIPRVYALHRAVYFRARYQFEELAPRFYSECARSTDPRTELIVCERNDGRLCGSLIVFYRGSEQQNKRIGIDYSLADSGLIYNLLNYHGIQRAIGRGIATVWLGQSSYLPKIRLGGELEDQYVLLKAYDAVLKPTLPLQRRWMARYSAANVQAGLERGASA